MSVCATVAAITGMAAAAPSLADIPGVPSHSVLQASSTPFALAASGLSPFTTVTGKVYMSEDGIGTNNPAGGPIFVQKHDASATVQAAYLLAAGIPGYVMQNGDVTLDGNSLSFAPADSVVGNFGVNSVWTDVTSIVKPKVDAAAPGNVQFTAAEPSHTSSIDGEILAVIMNDPTLPTNNTVSFLFGALDTTGDTFSIGLANPVNLSDPNLAMTMSIGDSYGYQGPPATGQYSKISVNGNLMTSSAGGNDDSICKYDTPQDFAACGNGTLITVGGIGDSPANPPDPTATDANCGPPGPPRCDDELYNLLPFVHNGDTSIKVNTINPSNNDNIFFTGFQLNSTAAVVGEGAVLTPVSGSNPVGSPYTLTAKVQDSNGNPIANQQLTFKVLSGPNAGKSGTATTDSNGKAPFTYTSSSAGTDTVQASFTDANGNPVKSNQATVTWTQVTGKAPVVDDSSNLVGSTSITDTQLTTSAPNDLVVAYVSADGPAKGLQSVTVSGSGLTWTRAVQQNGAMGDAEVWVAHAGTKKTITVKVTAAKPGYGLVLTDATYKNATGIGATGSFKSASGAPTGTITTTQSNSWVWAAGFDWLHASKRTVGSGQTLFSQNLDKANNTYWVQSTTSPTPAAGTHVTINDTAPTTDPFDLVLVEIL